MIYTKKETQKEINVMTFFPLLCCMLLTESNTFLSSFKKKTPAALNAY